jgi:hypothetical protein
MSRPGPLGSDLVIGMTLAEVFLLLLIVGWYGSRLESDQAGREVVTPAQVLAGERDLAVRERERQQQETEALRTRVRELEGVLDWLGQHLGVQAPLRDTASARGALDGYATGMRRGKAACDPDNVLVHVTGDRESLTVVLRKPFSVEGTTFAAGQQLSGPQEIERLLGAVQRYYAQRRAAGPGCAFDFTLAWRTDRDYRVARKQFEPYFYPAGDRQIP